MVASAVIAGARQVGKTALCKDEIRIDLCFISNLILKASALEKLQAFLSLHPVSLINIKLQNRLFYSIT